jgi:hypothetical protein
MPGIGCLVADLPMDCGRMGWLPGQIYGCFVADSSPRTPHGVWKDGAAARPGIWLFSG